MTSRTSLLLFSSQLKTCLHLIFKLKSVHNFPNCQQLRCYARVAQPLRRLKPKSANKFAKPMKDLMTVDTIGGKGGDGCISLLSVAGTEYAGTDGGNGGNGGHVIFQACSNVRDLSALKGKISAQPGVDGRNRECHGKCAEHTIIKVPVGTVIKRAEDEKVVGDLTEEGTMFVAARGGAGGNGNAHFKSDTNQTPQIAEIGAQGETRRYIVELKCMADFGLLGLPNAGKSTLLQAISRARPKVASYPFTTLEPYLGMIHYDDHEQIAVADLPGLIEDSHKNKGLGIKFLKHAERCSALLVLVDVSQESPWTQVDLLRTEMYAFSPQMRDRQQIVVANKIDVPGAEENLEQMKRHLPEDQIIGISAKHGINLLELLVEIKKIHSREKEEAGVGD